MSAGSHLRTSLSDAAQKGVNHADKRKHAISRVKYGVQIDVVLFYRWDRRLYPEGLHE